MTADYRAPAQTHIGHVHLKVSDLERSVAFYRDYLGFDVVARYGSQAAFLSAGGYHYYLGLNTWESQGGTTPLQAQPVFTISRSIIRSDEIWRPR